MTRRIVFALALGMTLATFPAAAQLNPMLPPSGGRTDSIVEAGSSMMYGPFVDINPDCSRRANPPLRILKKPRHGRAIIARREGNIRVPDDHPYPHCNLRRIVGPTVLYVPQPGFRGADYLSFNMRGLNGEVRRIDIDITVR
jgi:hypothetical protein